MKAPGTAYTEGKTRYEQEAFVPVRGSLADHGAVFVRFTARGAAGTVVAHVGFDGDWLDWCGILRCELYIGDHGRKLKREACVRPAGRAQPADRGQQGAAKGLLKTGAAMKVGVRGSKSLGCEDDFGIGI